jgi:hypothetical protein
MAVLFLGTEMVKKQQQQNNLFSFRTCLPTISKRQRHCAKVPTKEVGQSHFQTQYGTAAKEQVTFQSLSNDQ